MQFVDGIVIELMLVSPGHDAELLFDASINFSSAFCTRAFAFFLIRECIPAGLFATGCNHYRCIISSYHSRDADLLHCKIRNESRMYLLAAISSPCYRSRMRASEIGFNGPRPMYTRAYIAHLNVIP